MLRKRNITMRTLHHMSTGPAGYKTCVSSSVQKKHYLFFFLKPAFHLLPEFSALGYGNQRPLSATWTVTGAGACILGYEPPPRPDNKTLNTLRNRNICAVITGITTGRLIDFGFRDSLNMGACMAPAACDTIARNLQDFHRKPSDYDAIFTGDLGMVGQTILFDLLTEKGFDISSVHQDCGMLIYDPQTQDTHSGGSGCGCAASVLAGYILPGIIQKKWKRILFVPTGALLSKVSFNEGDPIPGIAHAVVIEQYRVPDMM